MRIATMATGGIGGYLAVKLGLAGHEVATIARGPHLEAIQRDGLTLEGPDGTERVQPWMATNDTSKVGPVDAIIFGVKGDSLESAAQACKPMLGPNTVVVPFLNGVEASDRIAEILPQHNVANGVAKVSTTITSPGVIKQVGQFSTFVFAERDNTPSDRIAALQRALNESGANAPVTEDIDKELWSKFVLFSAMSGVTAAGRCTFGDIRDIAQLGDLFKNVLAETATIGRKLGVALDDDLEAQIWERAQGFPAQMRASTAIDLEKGAPLEIEWVSGSAVRLARKAGIDAPFNTALYSILLPHKKGR